MRELIFLQQIQDIFLAIRKKIAHHSKKITIVSMVLLVYIGIFIFRFEIQGYLSFPGVQGNTREYTASHIQKISLDFEDINIRLPNGENLNGLYIDNESEKTVYYFHGNGGDLTFFYPTLKRISEKGYNVMAYDYPGYGKSTGFPYTNQITNASDYFFQYIAKEKGIEEKNIIVWGYSIGTGVGLEWASSRNIDSILLFAPYLSRYDLSVYHYGFPIQKYFFLPNSFRSYKYLETITAPVLFIHGNQDTLVPFDHGRRLFLGHAGEKYFLEHDMGNHYNFFENGVIADSISRFLEEKQLPHLYQLITPKDHHQWQRYNDIYKLDTETDTSLVKFVSPDVSFLEPGYIPEGLQELESEFIIDSKGNSKLHPIAAKQFLDMAEQFYTDMGEKMVVVSSYRSYAYQAGIKARGCPDSLCAKAGHSEHQSGLAIDLWSASTNAYWKGNARLTKYYNWLNENAHLYGFHNTYQKGVDIDGYHIEPWHWRYLGVPVSSYLKQENITFAELYNQKLDK